MWRWPPMTSKKRMPVPDGQLTLIEIKPEPRQEKKPKRKRITILEDRVTILESEAALIRGQLEREEELDEDDD